MDGDDDVDGDCKAFILVAFLALNRRSMVESNSFWLYYLGRVGKPCWGFGRVGISVIIKWNLSLPFVKMDKPRWCWWCGFRGKKQKKLHQKPPGLKLTPLTQCHPILGCWGGSARGLRLWATLGLSCKLSFCDLACTFFSFPKNKKVIVSMYVYECGCSFYF